MLDENDTTTDSTTGPSTTGPSASGQAEAGPGESAEARPAEAEATASEDPPAVRRTPRKATRKVGARSTRKAAAASEDPVHEVAEQGAQLAAAQVSSEDPADESSAPPAAKKAAAKRSPAKKAAAKKAVTKKSTSKRATKKAATLPDETLLDQAAADTDPESTGLNGSARDGVEETDDDEGAAATDPDATASDGLAQDGLDQDGLAQDGLAQDGLAQTAALDPDARLAPSQVRVAAPSLLFKAPVDLQDDTAGPADPDETGALGEADGSGEARETSDPDESAAATSSESDDSDEAGDSDDEPGGNRRRRRRGGRRRRRGGGGEEAEGADQDADDGSSSQAEASTGSEEDTQDPAAAPAAGKQGGRSGQRSSQRGGRGGAKQSGQPEAQEDGQPGSGPDRAGEQDDADAQDESPGSRRRRRRRRTGEEGDAGSEEPNTVVRVRKPRTAEDEITSLQGSTRLEAKKQRRREGREAGRRRAPIVSEAEFLARREAVERVMVIRQREDLTQIAVLEDKVLVEHYVARESQTSLIGNVYLGRVQNVLPSMEAAFVDIGKGRNAVLYAGEVNWDSLGAGNGPRKIEQVLKSGQPILVQVSKDPIGHKGARLTSQVSLPGRFLVYVPDGTTSGISRKLPDTERSRLKTLLKEIVPDSAGVIVRTAAEGASEDELTLDVERLTARWADIESKIAKGSAPQLLYGEPDLTLKVVRDLFTEDFAKLVIAGDEAWDLVDGYVKEVAPDLEERLERYSGDEDVFTAYRIDEQIAKGLDRKVWLPSGGSLVIDRTEAMTVVDVNTGKFTGSGGNLEETVTKNNLEAAEEMVRQLRLRDIGGIIVVDFIDMVLESNRDLVLRRLVECLGRDRTRHQVAEVTSLGLVQMTRKRIGTGLVESFSEPCDHCQGRGVVIHHEPVEPRRTPDEEPRRGRRGRGRGSDGDDGNGRAAAPVVKPAPSPRDIAAIAKHEPKPAVDVPVVDVPAAELTVSQVPAADVPAADVPAADVPATDVPAADVPATEGIAAEGSAVDTPTTGLPAVDVPLGAVPAELVPAETAADPAPAGGRPADTEPDATQRLDSGPIPAAGEEGQPPADPAPVVPAGPRLVTSTRRRVARRPAGPPSGGTALLVTADRNGGPDGAGEGQGAALVDAGRTQVEQAHVPVKRKGHKR